jgi:hypothetical protein
VVFGVGVEQVAVHGALLAMEVVAIMLVYLVLDLSIQ